MSSFIWDPEMPSEISSSILVLYKKVDKIILFDIDKTLFDRDGFLEGFYLVLKNNFGISENDVETVRKLYFESKNEYGYFSSEAYLAKIYLLHPDLEGNLDYFFEPGNLGKFLYDDARTLYKIGNARVGIFSKGDKVLQYAKIKNIESIFEDDLIYIHHDKMKELPGILERHNDSEVYIVDDQTEVHINAKSIDPSVKTILIDRKEKLTKVNGIDFRIISLFDIIPILNENT